MKLNFEENQLEINFSHKNLIYKGLPDGLDFLAGGAPLGTSGILNNGVSAVSLGVVSLSPVADWFLYSKT